MYKSTAIAALALALASISTASNAQEDQSEVTYLPEALSIHESGSFLGKVWHEMNSAQAQEGLSAICSYLGCTSAIPVIVGAIKATQPKTGRDYTTTGRIDKHVGEEWFIAFPAPGGYVTCNAAYDPKSLTANQGDTTSGTVFRNPATGENWVGTYNVVPINRPEGHWVGINFVVKFVKAGTETKHQCVPNGTRIWSVTLGK